MCKYTSEATLEAQVLELSRRFLGLISQLLLSTHVSKINLRCLQGHTCPYTPLSRSQSLPPCGRLTANVTSTFHAPFLTTPL